MTNPNITVFCILLTCGLIMLIYINHIGYFPSFYDVKHRFDPPIIFYYEPHVTDWFPIFNLSGYCPKYCIFTNQEELYNRSKVVIFFRTLFKKPPLKMQGQIWAYQTFESPKRTQRFLPKNGSNWFNRLDQFDMIMSYRQNSDIRVPFGKLHLSERPNNIKINFANVFKRKTKEVAWIVSHCQTPSRREEYVHELRKYIGVDIYGGCGNMRCPHRKGLTQVESFNECKADISLKYKFFLAFENSLCNNYSSEKLYAMFQQNNFMVPVVRGDPKIARYIPNGTYISTYDFKSPKELARYLKYVGSSVKRYSTYLKEKLKYNVTMWYDHYKPAICKLCNHLHERSAIQRRENFTLLDELYSDKCIEPNDLIFSNNGWKIR